MTISLQDLAVVLLFTLVFIIICSLLYAFRYHLKAVCRRLYEIIGMRVCWRRIKYKLCGCFFKPGVAERDAEKEIQEAEADKRIGFEIFDGLRIVDRQVAPKQDVELEQRAATPLTGHDFNDIEDSARADTGRRMLEE